MSSFRPSNGNCAACRVLAGEAAAGPPNKRVKPTVFSICGIIAVKGRRGSHAGWLNGPGQNGRRTNL